MNTAEPRLPRVEVVADLPVLWAMLQGLDFPATVDRHFPPPPHWKGPLSPGDVLALWLLFLVSQSDHCLNHVEPWVAQHRGTLSALLGKDVRPNCAHDDRLADLLTRLGGGEAFSGLERDLNQQTLRVYFYCNRFSMTAAARSHILEREEDTSPVSEGSRCRSWITLRPRPSWTTPRSPPAASATAPTA